MNIINLYENYFDEETKKIFEKLSDYNIYLVGGLVRDMLLNRSSKDIDITFEGNAIELANELDCEIISIHEDFGTVKIKINGINIDLASTRTESYPRRGHLPVVEKIGCTLKEDILRRDFTVNTLALCLNKNNFANIIDYTGGLNDLKNKTIRILHDKSFTDDPSRILRGLKYASRLGFNLDIKTLELQKKYLDNINYDMSYSRILNEFYRIDWTLDVFKAFIEQGIYKLINPNIKKDFDFWTDFKTPLIYLGLLLPDDRFELSKRDREIIEAVKTNNKMFKTDFEIYKTFSKQELEVAQILSILKNENAKHYLKDLKDIKVLTGGRDLIELGLTPSKKFSQIFDYILIKKLEKPNMTKEEELAIIKQIYV